MNNEILWALVAIMDGVKKHELPDMGFSDEDCDRIWNATMIAKASLEANNQSIPNVSEEEFNQFTAKHVLSDTESLRILKSAASALESTNRKLSTTASALESTASELSLAVSRLISLPKKRR